MDQRRFRIGDTETAIHNENREFVPDTILIRAGTSVRFPNDDPFFHSIYSSSPSDPFDIGYYGFGPGKLVEFPHTGVVENLQLRDGDAAKINVPPLRLHAEIRR